MKITFQNNDKVLTIVDFKDSDIPYVEQYYYNPYARGNKFPYTDFYNYIQELKEFNRKNGYFKSSEFVPGMTIELD